MVAKSREWAQIVESSDPIRGSAFKFEVPRQSAFADLARDVEEGPYALRMYGGFTE
jgi:hypothetical protein